MHAVGEDVIEEVAPHHPLPQETAEVVGEDGEDGVDLAFADQRLQLARIGAGFGLGFFQGGGILRGFAHLGKGRQAGPQRLTPMSLRMSRIASSTPCISASPRRPMQPMRKLSATVSLPG